MRIVKRLRLFLAALTTRASVESDLDEEMRFHIDMAAEHHARGGLSDDEARRQARVAFGSVEQHKEAMREGRGVRGLERVAFDLRFAARQLRMTPAFTLAAVLTLALGIGGNAVVFSVVNGVLLRPLDYPEPDRLVSIGHRSRGGDLPVHLPNSSATHVVYESGSRSFEAMALYWGWQGSLTGADAAPSWISALSVTRSLFDVLRVRPMLGRSFTAEEDQPNGPYAAILSHALWKERFGGDSAIIGRVITVNGVTRTVVGVMSPSFAFPNPAVQILVPMRVDRTNLGGFYLPGIARLREGVTPATATRELETLMPRVASIVDFLPLKVLREADIHPEARPFMDEVVGGVRTTLWTLWSMTALLLLIACVNVASLLLVRAEARRREVAVRLALGAERRHLIGQSLAESAILVGVGGALAATITWAGVVIFPRLAPESVPRMTQIHVDLTVVGAMTGIAAMIAIAFGLLPFLRGRAIAPSSVFRASDRAVTIDRRGGRLRQVLVATQIAMATVLLVGSGLVLRSFAKLHAVDPGFRADGAMTFRLLLPNSRYRSSTDVAQFHYTLLDRIRALPGVTAAGATNRLPLAVSMEADPVRVNGREIPAGTVPPLAEMRFATPGYFDAMGIPITAGRTFDRLDTDRISGAVIVTGAMAKKLLESRDPIGARVAHGLAGVHGQKPWSDVVGVVGDVRGMSLDKEPMGAIYYPMVTRPGVDMDWLARSAVYVVRANADPTLLMPAIRRLVAELDPEMPIAETRTLESVVDEARAPMRFSAIGFAIAAIVGLFMGAIGLYGVISYVTTQRTREIGVRIALGATPTSVRRSVVLRGVGVSVAGLLIGLAIALALRSLVAPLLYQVAPTDPLTMVAVAMVLLFVATLAAWFPARRAAGLDPIRALRAE
jgi:predicted permease